jgi:hypothetical protein
LYQSLYGPNGKIERKKLLSPSTRTWCFENLQNLQITCSSKFSLIHSSKFFPQHMSFTFWMVYSMEWEEWNDKWLQEQMIVLTVAWLDHQPTLSIICRNTQPNPIAAKGDAIGWHDDIFASVLERNDDCKLFLFL